MNRFKNWVLTDAHGDVWLDSFSASNDSLRLATPHDWSIRKRTLRGGLRDGIDLIELHNGALSLSLLPTRGMGLWRGDYRGLALGWRSPVEGPVHPKYVNLAGRGGLGWLDGFDELLARCGLASNGPPTAEGSLHGRIANTPASAVEVSVSLDPPHELRVTGEVEEAALFFPQLRLRTTYATVPGSNKVVITDRVDNRGARPAEMQMLYHFNLGPPFLGAGSRVLAPIREMAPMTARAAEDMSDGYAAPTPGFAEQVYAYELLPDGRGRTLALLVGPNADKAVCLRWDTGPLPCFTVWKCSMALEEGYVTGLEPATGYPNPKPHEREKGRVRTLAPGGHWTASLSLEVADTKEGVVALQAEVATLQAQGRAVIHRTPQARFSSVG
ncbi:MAG: aldose 1-epimerase family protein [Gemmataceae bacterium]|nr:aldose 1-epimerase family protein [Gemmataceae bacterium]